MNDRSRNPVVDRDALARTGALVRARLAADPSVYRFPVETAEIFAVGDFLSAAECERLVGLVDAVAKPSAAFHVSYAANYRTSYSGDVDRADSFVRMIERRICDLLGIDEAWGEAIQGQRYLPGQEFQAHFDWFDTAAEYWPEEKRRGGQRSWTAMAYLNEVEEGGRTEFNRLGLGVTPQPGALLVWNNATPEGLPNPAVMHAALPVTKGIKYVVTKWFRTRPWG